MRGSRVALTIIWLLSLVAVCSANDIPQIAERFSKLDYRNKAAVKEAVGQVSPSVYSSRDWRNYADAKTTDAEKEAFDYLKRRIEAIAAVSKASSIAPATSQIKSIKSGALFRDPGVNGSSSWLAEALDRIRNIRFKPPKLNLPSGPAVNFPFGPIIVYCVWTVIIIVAVALVYYGLRQVNWKKRLARKAKAVVEEDEPERSLDEWLEQADLLTKAGKYREAVRALYLACLLKFDEGRVARFDRGETNWEHLARIESSPRLPAGIRFRVTTQAFDRIWYGNARSSGEEVSQFRAWYTEIKTALEGQSL